MKKSIISLLTVSSVFLLSACGTTNVYDKRAEEIRERQIERVEVAIDKAPKWMMELPKSNSAVYAAGTSISGSMSFSKTKAVTIAYSRICMAAGGKVDQQTKIFQSDSDSSSTERSETAIRSFCNGVDISGAEIVEVKQVAEGSRFRTYVLVALPIGDANAIQQLNDKRKNEKIAVGRSKQAFDEMDARRNEDTRAQDAEIRALTPQSDAIVTPVR
jgi:hypothetical protein